MGRGKDSLIPADTLYLQHTGIAPLFNRSSAGKFSDDSVITGISSEKYAVFAAEYPKKVNLRLFFKKLVQARFYRERFPEETAIDRRS
jgi:hypothetical protein